MLERPNSPAQNLQTIFGPIMEDRGIDMHTLSDRMCRSLQSLEQSFSSQHPHKRTFQEIADALQVTLDDGPFAERQVAPQSTPAMTKLRRWALGLTRYELGSRANTGKEIVALIEQGRGEYDEFKRRVESTLDQEERRLHNL